MAEKVKLNVETDAKVAMELFYLHIGRLSDKDKDELIGNEQNLLKTFSNFVYAIKFCQNVSKI